MSTRLGCASTQPLMLPHLDLEAWQRSQALTVLLKVCRAEPYIGAMRKSPSWFIYLFAVISKGASWNILNCSVLYSLCIKVDSSRSNSGFSFFCQNIPPCKTLPFLVLGRNWLSLEFRPSWSKLKDHKLSSLGWTGNSNKTHVRFDFLELCTAILVHSVDKT